MKKSSLCALVAAGLLAGGLSAGSASAADLGGNCCADLEERIAELEATTARKGNRKVSLTISGWVGGLRDPRRSDGQRLAHSRPVLAAQRICVGRQRCLRGSAASVLLVHQE